MSWYRDLICTIHKLENTAKKAFKIWNWPLLISHYYKPPILTLVRNPKWSEIRDIIFKTKIVKFTGEKRTEYVQTVQVELYVNSNTQI